MTSTATYYTVYLGKTAIDKASRATYGTEAGALAFAKRMLEEGRDVKITKTTTTAETLNHKLF